MAAVHVAMRIAPEIAGHNLFRLQAASKLACVQNTYNYLSIERRVFQRR
jgi:hypothetical protein